MQRLRRDTIALVTDPLACGALILGPVGCGKSALARTVALCRYLFVLTTTVPEPFWRGGCGRTTGCSAPRFWRAHASAPSEENRGRGCCQHEKVKAKRDGVFDGHL